MAAVHHRLDLGAVDSEVLEGAVIEPGEFGNGLPARAPGRVVSGPAPQGGAGADRQRPSEVAPARGRRAKGTQDLAKQVAKQFGTPRGHPG